MPLIEVPILGNCVGSSNVDESLRCTKSSTSDSFNRFLTNNLPKTNIEVLLLSRLTTRMKIFGTLILCLATVLLVNSTIAGTLIYYLFGFLLLSLAAMIVTHIRYFTAIKVDWSFPANGLTRHTYVLRGILRNAAWLVIGVCLCIAVPLQFSPKLFSAFIILVSGSVVLLCVLDWIPRAQVGTSLNITLSVFLLVLTYQLFLTYWPAHSSNRAEVAIPFEKDWFIFHGGKSALVNHHHHFGSQKYAMDIILPKDGLLMLNQPTDLRKYDSFGESLYSPVDGVIAAVQNSLPDQKIGETDGQNIAGNNIVIKTETSVFLLLAHLKNGSILVTLGDEVKAGQKIAEIGNSGNTTQPHLHMQAMTKVDFLSPKSKPIPISFKIEALGLVSLKRNDILPGKRISRKLLTSRGGF